VLNVFLIAVFFLALPRSASSRPDFHTDLMGLCFFSRGVLSYAFSFAHKGFGTKPSESSPLNLNAFHTR